MIFFLISTATKDSVVTKFESTLVNMAESITWKNCPDELEALKQKVFGPESNQLLGIVSEPYGVHALPAMKNVAKKIETFEIRTDDIWIVTYPKCGTTLTQVTTIESQTRTQVTI